MSGERRADELPFKDIRERACHVKDEAQHNARRLCPPVDIFPPQGKFVFLSTVLRSHSTS